MPISKGAKIAIFVTVVIVVIAGSLVTYFMLIKRKPQAPSPAASASAPLNLNGKWVFKEIQPPQEIIDRLPAQYRDEILNEMVTEMKLATPSIIFIDDGSSTIVTKPQSFQGKDQNFNVITRTANLIEIKPTGSSSENEIVTSVDGKILKLLKGGSTGSITLIKESNETTMPPITEYKPPQRCEIDIARMVYCDGRYISAANRVAGSEVCVKVNDKNVLLQCNNDASSSNLNWSNKGETSCSSYIDNGVTYQCK